MYHKYIKTRNNNFKTFSIYLYLCRQFVVSMYINMIINKYVYTIFYRILILNMNLMKNTKVATQYYMYMLLYAVYICICTYIIQILFRPIFPYLIVIIIKPKKIINSNFTYTFPTFNPGKLYAYIRLYKQFTIILFFFFSFLVYFLPNDILYNMKIEYT